MTKRRKPDITTKRPPPFGATKAQGKVHERERGYKNRIHDLEQTEKELRETVARLSSQLEGAWKLIASLTPTQARYDAVKKLALMDVYKAQQTGILNQTVVLAMWLHEWDAALASGKDSLMCNACGARHKPGQHTRCKPIGDNTVKYTDGHGKVIREEAL